MGAVLVLLKNVEISKVEVASCGMMFTPNFIHQFIQRYYKKGDKQKDRWK
jgi:hypothetical protein